MGMYINKMPDGTRLGLTDKSERIAAMAGVTELRFNELPDDIDGVPPDKFLVAIVWNSPWEAALVCDMEYEFKQATRPGQDRPVRYFLVDRDDVRAMADGPLYSEVGV